ncbi:MAG TPA: MerR family transcriptional regulator [Beijerinckiaceae bacterium]|jgi:DNA-binding transcriptional MerR regulator|nr:MerR family transcriptional regulator [Beijerinckiaceae bacterium]
MTNDNDRESSSVASSSRQTEAKAPNTYLIGDLAREFGVSLRTLRFYESRGMLSPRRDGTARLYDERDRERLAAILDGKRLGFTLTEIRDMLEDKRRDGTKAKLALSLPEIEDQIEHLEAQKAQIEDALRELRRQHERLRAAA